MAIRIPKLNVMFIDDSEAMHKNMKLYFFTYSTQYLMHYDKSITNKFYIPDMEFVVDYFLNIEEFLKQKKDKYDLAIIDWNLAPSNAASINERGDVVVQKLGYTSKVKVILTGMTHDVIDKESDLNMMAKQFPNTIIKTKTTQTIQDLYEIIVKFFK